MNQQLAKVNEQLKKMTIIDELINIANRRGFQQYMQESLMTSNGKRKLSIIMIDIDAFKLSNDHYGHLEGDKVIKSVAQILKHHVIDSSISVSARFGGEEFVVAVFETEEREIYKLAEDIRASIFAAEIPHNYSPVTNRETISAGLATDYVKNENDIIQLLKHADSALYKSKSKGRNCVERYTIDEYEEISTLLFR